MRWPYKQGNGAVDKRYDKLVKRSPLLSPRFRLRHFYQYIVSLLAYEGRRKNLCFQAEVVGTRSGRSSAISESSVSLDM